MTTTAALQPVAITLTPEGDRIQIKVTADLATVYSRSTKYDAGIVGRVERYLREAGIYRQTSYSNIGPSMLATGTRTI
jgi:hypothetical protein